MRVDSTINTDHSPSLLISLYVPITGSSEAGGHERITETIQRVPAIPTTLEDGAIEYKALMTAWLRMAMLYLEFISEI